MYIYDSVNKYKQYYVQSPQERFGMALKTGSSAKIFLADYT